MLGPALEKVVGAFHGKAVLAKVNVDENRELAGTWSIRSIPAIKIFKAGKVAKELMGALPEADLHRELSQIIPSEADTLVAKGDRLMEAGKADQAEDCYIKALADEPGHSASLVRLARIAMAKPDFAEARRLAAEVGVASDDREEAETVLSMIAFAEDCWTTGGVEAAEPAAKSEPENLDAKYRLACCLAAAKKYDDALSLLLVIIERERHWSDEKAKKAMLKIFGIIGQRSPLADDYRERLTRTLYS